MCVHFIHLIGPRDLYVEMRERGSNSCSSERQKYAPLNLLAVKDRIDFEMFAI